MPVPSNQALSKSVDVARPSFRRSSPADSSSQPEAKGLKFHLGQLGNLKQSGTLVVVRSHATSRLVFRQGQLVLAKGGYGGVRLGRILLESEYLREQELVQVLSDQQADRGRVPLGRLLVKSRRVEEAKVKKALELQCKRVLASVLKGSPAQYHWLSGSWGDFAPHQEKLVKIAVSVGELTEDSAEEVAVP